MGETGAFDERSGEREAWQQPAPAPPRPRPNLPTEMPRPAGARESSRISALVSVALHVLIIMLLLLPALLSSSVRSALATGAGGAGPAGGGGGSGGSFGPRETLRYVRVAPDPPALQPTAATVPTPVPPKPVVKPPVPQVQPQATPPPPVDAAPATGGAAGAGSTSGAGGAGPGTGGGTGSGVGTGTGSANGPGTGGGLDSIYPPQPIEVFIPPTPVPSKVRPYTLVAQFDVDSTGKVLNVAFNETGDGGYNKKLRAQLGRIRFRPAVKRDGRPVRATVPLTYDIY